MLSSIPGSKETESKKNKKNKEAQKDSNWSFSHHI
jgi:hypothetical protein